MKQKSCSSRSKFGLVPSGMWDLLKNRSLHPAVVQLVSKMSNLPFFNTPSANPLEFLQQQPLLFDALLADCNYDLDELTRLIQPALAVTDRCQHTPYYIQAIAIGETHFLMTNVAAAQTTKMTPYASTWLIGRSPACAISICDRLISRCHAVIGHHASYGFYITDLNSSNGTQVNHRRLTPAEQYVLRDGDLLQLGKLQLEFFLASQFVQAGATDKSTCH